MQDADKRAIGKQISFFRDWVNHPQQDSYWADIDGIDRNRALQSTGFIIMRLV